MGSGTIQKFLTICQLEEVLISSGRASVPWLCGILERHLHGGQTNRGY